MTLLPGEGRGPVARFLGPGFRRGTLALAVLILAVPTPAASAPEVKVEVLRDGDAWTADFTLAKAAPAWAFYRSAVTRVGAKPWRPQAWTIETPGVRLERRGFYDVLTSESGDVPSRVRVRFRPFGEDLEADYEPALIFTDGSVALFTNQFDLMPLASAAAAEKLSLDLGAHPETGQPAQVTFRDEGGEVLHGGARHASLSLVSGNSYVLFGPAAPIETRDIAAIIDPALPRWIADELAASTPRLLAYYANRLGPRSGVKPTLMASWMGPTPKLESMGGSVLPGLVIMAFEGEGLKQRSEALIAASRWFVAHESAHFWLGETVRYDRGAHAWITEGGADLLAVRASAAIDPTYNARGLLNAAIDDCITLGAGKAVNGAAERNENRAYYACGAVFGLVAEAAVRRVQPNHDFFDFLARLIETNRADGVVSKEEWLAQLTKVSRDASLADDIRAMTDQGVADPKAVIASLFLRAGVRHSLDADGRPRV